MKEVLNPPDNWSFAYWFTVLSNNGTLYLAIGGVLVAFILLYFLFRTPKS